LSKTIKREKKMPTLKGIKVVLRAVKKQDINLFLQWFNDPEVIQYLQFYLPLTEIAEEKWYLCMSESEKDVVFVIEAIVSETETRPIGNCGLHEIKWKDRCATAGIAIGEKEFWSKGYGTEAANLMIRYAFEHLNLRRISTSVYDFNERSLNMQLKIGFKVEGRRREAIFKNNRYVDEVVLGLLKKEWEN
jgi:RimJ/RimL family protein N-acetyltransferase